MYHDDPSFMYAMEPPPLKKSRTQHVPKHDTGISKDDQVLYRSPVRKWSVFPEEISTRVGRIEYPDRHGPFADEATIKVIVGYLERDRIYFEKRKLTPKYLNHFGDVGKGSRVFREFNHDSINWKRLVKRHTRDRDENTRQNTDLRTSYKFENKFLASAYFTFGQQTVKPGQAHVVQTLKVPVLFYLLPRIYKKRAVVRDKFFPFEQLCYYSKYILLPNGTYRIPERTTYFLLTTQKTFFSLDIVEESYQLPFEWKDPVVERVTKLPVWKDDLPPQTPYIEQEQEDDEYVEIFKRPRCDFATEDRAAEDRAAVDRAAVEQQQPQQLYMVFPPLPVLEKNVVVASPDFVDRYRQLQLKEYQDPKKTAEPVFPCEENIVPMDLTFSPDPPQIDPSDPPQIEKENQTFSPDQQAEENILQIDLTDDLFDDLEDIVSTECNTKEFDDLFKLLDV